MCERYLADEPVLACPPSAWYRLRKLARRNRGRFVAAGVLGLALVVAVGGIGWTALDRAARQTRAANELEVALERAEFFQGQGKRAEALAAFERAELLAGQAWTDPARDERLAALKERLAAEKRDQEFIARFEDIRLERGKPGQCGREPNSDTELAFPEIRDALDHYYGIAIGARAPAQAAAIVQGRPEPVRASLVAALDRCLRLAPKGDAQTREWLLATLDAADSDPWRVRVRRAMRDGDRKALESLARAVNVRSQPPSFLLSVAEGLATESRLPYPQQGLASESLVDSIQLELLRRIQRDYPTDLWANHELGMMLAASGRPAEAVRYFTAAIALRPDNPGIYLNRGSAFRDAGEMDAAIADFSQALALAPLYAEWPTPTSATPCWQGEGGRGHRLLPEGHRPQSEVRLRPQQPRHRSDGQGAGGRGHRLLPEGHPPQADFAEAHYNLGNALVDKGKVDEAIATTGRPSPSIPSIAEAHYNLGIALLDKGKVDEAIAEYREAIRLKPDFPDAHYNLGNALRDQGQAGRGHRRVPRGHPPQAGLRRGPLQPGSTLSSKRGSSARPWRSCAAATNSAPGTRAGLTPRPSGCGSANAWSSWTRSCPASSKARPRRRAPTSGSSWPGCAPSSASIAPPLAFTRKPSPQSPQLADDLGASHRYNAACAAALAGCGQGKDADKLDGKERGRLRRQALDWLRADLDGWRRLLDKKPDKVRPVIVEQMRHWLEDTDFAGVRGPEALAKLPEAERQPWQKLWDDVADTLARAQANTAPEKKSAAK